MCFAFLVSSARVVLGSGSDSVSQARLQSPRPAVPLPLSAAACSLPLASQARPSLGLFRLHRGVQGCAQARVLVVCHLRHSGACPLAWSPLGAGHLRVLPALGLAEEGPSRLGIWVRVGGQAGGGSVVSAEGGSHLPCFWFEALGGALLLACWFSGEAGKGVLGSASTQWCALENGAGWAMRRVWWGPWDVSGTTGQNQLRPGPSTLALEPGVVCLRFGGVT